jgi:tetratricopeptide (TPR) repeat protein
VWYAVDRFRRRGATSAGGVLPLSERPFRFIHRDLVILLALCALAVVAFLVTRDAAASNDELFLTDAATWYRTGLEDLKAGRTADAVEALRRAAFVNDADPAYHLAHARALAADGQDDLARAELLTLRARTPEDPEINLELARLEARGADVGATARYYESALYGVWPEARAEDRSRVRVELIRYLLSGGQESAALAEILALTGNMPDTVEWEIEAADLFMAAGDAGRALDTYARVLAVEAADGRALAGAGRAAFALDDFVQARRYLTAAPDDLPEVVELREVSDLVLSRDPLAARLSTEQRRQRLLANVSRAEERLTECAETVTVSAALALAQKALEDFEPLLAPAAFRESADAVDTGVALVARVQNAADRLCAPPAPVDRALAIIGRLHVDES